VHVAVAISLWAFDVTGLPVTALYALAIIVWGDHGTDKEQARVDNRAAVTHVSSILAPVLRCTMGRPAAHRCWSQYHRSLRNSTRAVCAV
jgi:hypothetical protein